MSGAMHVGGVSFRLCLFFAANPEEWLTSDDIAKKFGTSKENVWQSLRSAVRLGWLLKDAKTRAGNEPNVYRPGPNLRQAIGLPSGIQ